MTTKTTRIGLNVLFFRADKTGGGETYANGLLAGLQRSMAEFEYFAFVTRESVQALSHLESPNFHVIGVDSPRSRSSRHLWEQFHFQALCEQYRIDLLHSLGNVSPILLRRKR